MSDGTERASVRYLLVEILERATKPDVTDSISDTFGYIADDARDALTLLDRASAPDRALVEALLELADAYSLTLDHTCPPAPNACGRCVLLRRALAALPPARPVGEQGA